MLSILQKILATNENRETRIGKRDRSQPSYCSCHLQSCKSLRDSNEVIRTCTLPLLENDLKLISSFLDIAIRYAANEISSDGFVHLYGGRNAMS
jgi:hypothetical protein